MSVMYVYTRFSTCIELEKNVWEKSYLFFADFLVSSTPPRFEGIVIKKLVWKKTAVEKTDYTKEETAARVKPIR